MKVLKKKNLKLKIKTKTKKTISDTPLENSVTDTPQEVDLRKMLDYKQPFKMIYSGVENEQYFNLLYSMGIRNFLMSYHYITEKKISMSKFKDKNVKFICSKLGFRYFSNGDGTRRYSIDPLIDKFYQDVILCFD